MNVDTGDADEFGALLQQYRLAAGLSQAELAEQAGLSTRGISDLERGARQRPYPATARRLAAALGLDEAARARLLATRPRPPAPTAVHQTELPRELTSFIGREHELDEVAGRLAEAVLVTVAGPGGAGKTRLVLRLARHLLDRGAFADRGGVGRALSSAVLHHVPGLDFWAIVPIRFRVLGSGGAPRTATLQRVVGSPARAFHLTRARRKSPRAPQRSCFR